MLGVVGVRMGAPTQAAERAGCDHTRPAVAHHAGRVALASQPVNAPVPCATTTGYPSAENRIAVTNSGAVFYAPAVMAAVGTTSCPSNFADSLCTGIARTTNDGESWSAILPPGPFATPGVQYTAQDHQLFVDKSTGRLFWQNPTNFEDPQGSALVFSDDDGATWVYSATCCGPTENPRLTFAPPTFGQVLPVGYPNVVYFCSDLGPIFVPTARHCQKSLDGGNTWELHTSMLFSSPVPQHPECGSSGEKFGPGDGNYPQAASDGSLYVMVQCGGQSYLARSTDEATTWPIVRTTTGDPLTIPTGNELRIDRSDNFYLVASSNPTELTLRVSRDMGVTWGAPLDVIAPGVNAINKWYVAVGEPGHVAVSYYGQTIDQLTWDGYLTDTTDALDADPVFWSAQLNDPATPLLFASALPVQTNGQLDYIGVDIGPDGTPWASFLQQCGASPLDASCTSRLPERPVTNNSVGFAGRLAPAT